MKSMIKNGKCTKFQLDNNTKRCKFYGGSEEVIEACYYNCKKRNKVNNDKKELLGKCITGAIID